MLSNDSEMERQHPRARSMTSDAGSDNHFICNAADVCNSNHEMCDTFSQELPFTLL